MTEEDSLEMGVLSYMSLSAMSVLYELSLENPRVDVRCTLDN